MVSSFCLRRAADPAKNGIELSTHALLITIVFTTVCWCLTAYLGPGTDRETSGFLQEGSPVRPRLDRSARSRDPESEAKEKWR